MDENRNDSSTSTSDASTDRPLFVVGVGASAGGLEAIQTLFDHTHDRTGAAFVVVQHLSPDFESMMGELLARHTSMPIHTVTEPVDLAPNEIYLIAPRRNLVIRDGRLIPEDYPRGQVLNLPINVFFRSLAASFGDRALAIVLSGTGSDGAVGVRSVREMGGVVMVQDEASARFDGMPHAAMATGMVDFVLAPQDMPTEIQRYIQFKVGDGPTRTDAATLRDHDRLGQILALVRQETRLDFSQYKVNTILRRVERRIGLTQSVDVDGYVDLLMSSPSEVLTLGQDLLIGVTNFFRDPDAFELLAEDVVPGLVEEAQRVGELRVWVAGCATGEEAYSLAILIHEELERRGGTLPFKVFATDIDRRAIERASRGVYHEGFVIHVNEDRRHAYFDRRGDDYQVIPAIREKVVFAVHDLVKDPPFTRIDLIACRNLLIYFQPILQHRALSRMLFALRQEGILWLGPSESVGELQPEFDTIDARWKILRKRTDARVITPAELHQQMRTTPPRALSPGTASSEWANTPVGGPRTDEIVHAAARHYVPAGVALSESFQIIHIFGAVERYLRFPSGPPDFDVVRLARGDLSIPLATAVRKALKDQSDVVYDDVSFTDDRSEHRLTLRVRYCSDPRTDRPYLLVFFEPPIEASTEAASSGRTPSVDAQAKQRIGDLEQELQHTREDLQATIEELETSNQELYTVNADYQKKLDELIELNSDMDQLLSSTSVAVLFLDRALRVRRFTETVGDLFHGLERDIGRPIQRLTTRFACEDLVQKIERVRSTRAAFEEEVDAENGAVFVMSIRPHGAITEQLRGVVVSFFDVTRLRRTERESARRAQRLEIALASMNAGAAVWEDDGTGLRTVGAFAEILGLDEAAFPDTLPGLEALLSDRVTEDERGNFEARRGRCFRAECPTCTEDGESRVDRWHLKTADDDTVEIELTCRSLSVGNDRTKVLVAHRIVPS